MSSQITNHLAATGYNHDFIGSNLAFSEYIQKMQEIITLYHTHQPQFSQAMIIEANSPFDWPAQRAEQGVVLVHGLTEAAFQMKDMAYYFKQRGFWVRSILLPGHGTVPGDLLNVKLAAWRAAVDYAVTDLAKQISQVFVCGYSAGGALALDCALRLPQIQGLILFAPALRLKRYIEMTVRAQMLIKTIWKRAHWLKIRPEIDYAKYLSLPVNAVFQLQLLIDSLTTQLQVNKLTIPTFTIITEDDEVIDCQRVISCYQEWANPLNRLLIYSREASTAEKGVLYRNSHLPEQGILNFSHVSLATSPDNAHYGKHGDYLPYLSYYGNAKASTVYQGAVNLVAPKNYRVQRLTYNPDFAGMLELLDGWFNNLNLSPECDEKALQIKSDV